MSAGKLDQSLDEIMKDSNTTRARPGRRQPRRAATKAQTSAATAAPVGGVKKTKKDTRAKTTAPAIVPSKSGESKIIVSGLPDDVSEMQIKDYFGKTVGPTKRVQLQYGPNGRSRGSATITFVKGDSAAKAASELNGVKVDNRAMRIEVIMGAGAVAAPAPARSLGDRVSQPKSAAKTKTKTTTTDNKKPANGAAKGQPKKKSGRAGRPKVKSQEELDQEMADYFGGNEGAAANGAAVNGGTAAGATTNGGDAGMEDEVM